MVVVRHRERAVEVVVEGEVGLVVPPERAGPAQLGRRDPRRGLARVTVAVVHVEEAVVQAVVVREVRRAPAVRGVEEAELRAVRVRIRDARRVGAERSTVELADRVGWVARRIGRRLDRVGDPLRRLVGLEVAEVAVERTILLHQHHDVLDGNVRIERRGRRERLRRHGSAGRRCTRFGPFRPPSCSGACRSRSRRPARDTRSRASSPRRCPPRASASCPRRCGGFPASVCVTASFPASCATAGDELLLHPAIPHAPASPRPAASPNTDVVRIRDGLARPPRRAVSIAQRLAPSPPPS